MKVITALLLFLVSSAAHAQPASAQACTGCHGAHGEGGSTGAPRLAGQPHAYLARQLEAYADGRRVHSVMTPIAKGLQPQDRDALAAYYAGLQAPSKPPQLGGDTKRGSTLATRGDESKRVQACANCHGPAGSGQNGVNPYLAGLDPRYLEAALGEWKSGNRKTDPSQQMVQIAKSLSDADIKALAAYYAHQPAPQVAQDSASGAASSARGASAPTKPGAAGEAPAGIGATGGEATTGGSQGPGGGGGGSGSGSSGSR
jgi:cytochrome c553